MTLINPVTPLLSYSAPYAPITNITPFTYRDGLTYLEILEGLRCYITDTVVPYVDTEFGELGNEFVTQVNTMIDAVNTQLDTQTANTNAAIAAESSSNAAALAAQTTSVNESIAALTTFVNNTVATLTGPTANDVNMQTVITSVASATRILLDSLYAAKATTYTKTQVDTNIAAVQTQVTANTTNITQHIADAVLHAADHVFYVSTVGSDANTGLAAGVAFATIAAAVAAIGSTGGKIVILPGSYTISAPIVINSVSNITIEGAGANATAITTNGNFDAFQITGTASQITIKNLWIGTFAVRSAGWGFTLLGTSAALKVGYVTIENVTIQNMYSGITSKWADSVYLTNVRYSQTIAGAQGGNAVIYAISCASHMYQTVFVVALTGTMPGDCFRLDSDTDTMVMSKCLGVGGKNGINFSNSIGGASSGPRLSRLTDSHFESNTVSGVLISDCRDLRLKGVHSAVNAAVGFQITGGTSVKLTSCMSLQNGTYGYSVTGATVNDAALIGCDSSNNSQSATGTLDGFSIGPTVSHVRVIGCRSGDFVFAGTTQRYGITVSATATDWIIIQGCDTLGNTNAAGLNNASTGTHNSISGNVT